MMKIAILGSTGHIGKNLTYYFGKEENYELFLFTRDDKSGTNISVECELKNNFSIRNYNEFNDSKYDAVINCVGLSDPAKIESSQGKILETTETFDTMTLDYLERFPDCKLINFSSGIVYGGDFSSPITETILINEKFDIKNIKSEYALAKINSEIRHRKLNHFNIIDLRLFSFFSRFMDLKSKFFMSDVVSAVKLGGVLVHGTDFFRDYIHPQDLFSFIKKCASKESINDVFDLYSKMPIGSFELLDNLHNKFHNFTHHESEELKYKILTSSTGFKKYYFSQSKKAEELGYKPRYSSLDTISEELPYFLKNK